jgi:hypothetical protein
MAALTVASLVGVSGCAPGGGNGGQDTIVVTVTLGRASIAVGGTTSVVVQVTRNGPAASGVTVTINLGTPAVASLDPATGQTNAQGRISSFITGEQAGTTTVTATALGTTSSARTLTVTAPSPERLVFQDQTTSVISVAANQAGGGTIAEANIGGGVGLDARELLGVQRDGDLALVVDTAHDNGWIRNLQTGTDAHVFAPDNLTPNAFWGSAAITPDGDLVYWLRQAAGHSEIVRAGIDGSNAETVYAGVPNDVLFFALSQDGAAIAIVTDQDAVVALTVEPQVGTPTAVDTEGFTTLRGIAWLDATHLAVAAQDQTIGIRPCIFRASTTGGAAQVLFDDDGLGLRTTPEGLGVDRDGNIVYDEQSDGGADHNIYRLDAPAYAERVAIVTRDDDDLAPLVVAW